MPGVLSKPSVITTDETEDFLRLIRSFMKFVREKPEDIVIAVGIDNHTHLPKEDLVPITSGLFQQICNDKKTPMVRLYEKSGSIPGWTMEGNGMGVDIFLKNIDEKDGAVLVGIVGVFTELGVVNHPLKGYVEQIRMIVE